MANLGHPSISTCSCGLMGRPSIYEVTCSFTDTLQRNRIPNWLPMRLRDSVSRFVSHKVAFKETLALELPFSVQTYRTRSPT